MVIKCKECSAMIEYERGLVTVFSYKSRDKKSGTKTVYLTCANGHTNPYHVNVEE